MNKIEITAQEVDNMVKLAGEKRLLAAVLKGIYKDDPEEHKKYVYQEKVYKRIQDMWLDIKNNINEKPFNFNLENK